MKLFLSSMPRKHIPKMELRGGGKPNFGEIKQKLNKGQKRSMTSVNTTVKFIKDMGSKDIKYLSSIHDQLVSDFKNFKDFKDFKDEASTSCEDFSSVTYENTEVEFVYDKDDIFDN
jgi:hypothetical protein